MIQTFTILGIPKAQGRPRFARMGSFVKTYDPKDSRQYKDNVAAQIVAQQPVFCEGPLRVELCFYLPRPKTLSKKVLHHTKKPDLDNLIKGTKDAMKGIVWRDDSQVVNLEAAKIYTETEPKVEIRVKEIEQKEG
jgi:Holliday junction resolvase RusA-like endonuclease